MAHGVKEGERPKVHQALHGYADGHRQLALSTTLKPKDQKTLLALSDISGPGARIEEEGYLTGYPLTDSGVFALARTWPAPEMPRPGCVWTHTLLIDFADLAVLPYLGALASLFRRPSGQGEALWYGKPQKLPTTVNGSLMPEQRSWARQVLMALYGKPNSRIVALSSGPGVDHAVLALWSQQWPRLRRSFRFCTFAVSDRSVEGASFDLQVLPALDRSSRSRFASVVDADSMSINASPWVGLALQDLLKPNTDGLRSFFRQLGSDMSYGRKAFQPLCQLHDILGGLSDRPDAVREAIQIVREEFAPKEARTARIVVAKAALDRLDTLDKSSFEFLWSHLGDLEPSTLIANAARIGRLAWCHDPLWLVAPELGEFEIVFERTIAELELDDLLKGLDATPELTVKVLPHRPELVGRAEFWRGSEGLDEALRLAAQSSQQLVAAKAMVIANRDDLAIRAVQALGPRPILSALSAHSAHCERSMTWVKAAVLDPGAVADFLAGEDRIDRDLLFNLAQVLNPDTVPNDYGSDPWLTGWNHSVGTLDDAAFAYMAAYLLSRALGSRTHSAAELAQLSFEVTYAAVAHDCLPVDGWRLIEPCLPWSAFWFEWDRCKRLRAGVVALFVDHDLSPRIFARLVQDEQLFMVLANDAARRDRGHAYLERVRQEIKDEGDSILDGRVRMIEKHLD